MSAVRIVKLGEHEVEFPSNYLQQLQDDNDKLDNRQLLIQALEQKGYLFIRGLHDREQVLGARRAVLRHIHESGGTKLDGEWEEGKLNHRCGLGCVPFMEGRNDITHCAEVLDVLEGPRPKAFFKKLFDEDPITFDFKWLRAIPHEVFTGCHVDMVYMGRGTRNLCTMWTPFGDTVVEMGTLAICEGSHVLPGFQHFQDTYGNLDIEKENLKGTGWFTTNPKEITERFGGQWKTSDFKAGDVLIFTMRTVHMSTSNITDLARISCDTRWLRASEQTDSRYMGHFNVKTRFGAYDQDDQDNPDDANSTSISDWKNQWGFQ